VLLKETEKSPLGNLYFDEIPPEDVEFCGIIKIKLPFDTKTLSGFNCEKDMYSLSLIQLLSSNTLKSSTRKSEEKTPELLFEGPSKIHEERNTLTNIKKQNTTKKRYLITQILLQIIKGIFKRYGNYMFVLILDGEVKSRGVFTRGVLTQCVFTRCD